MDGKTKGGGTTGNLILYWASLLIPVAIFMPNLLWLLLPPVNTPSLNKAKEAAWLTVGENAGRVGVIVIPLFYPVVLDEGGSFYIISMLLLLGVYYSGWIRFFHGGRRYILLFAPLWRIPVPMAISPVLYFMVAAGLLHSVPMLIAALLLAIGHIPISYREYRRLRDIS